MSWLSKTRYRSTQSLGADEGGDLVRQPGVGRDPPHLGVLG